MGVCLGSGFGCAPPGQAGLLGCVCVPVSTMPVACHSWLECVVPVCIWASVSAAPRNSWLGCPGVCVFVCPLRLYPATPGRGVWCAGWLCVLGLGFRLRPASPGWGVGVCVCSCAPCACTLPLLAGLCGVGVCLGSGFSCSPPLLASGFGVSVCLCARPACTPPLLPGVLGCVCARAPATLVPRHSWLGCAVWVCVSGLRVRLRPATPGWGVRVYVFLCARSACTPQLLAGVCRVGVSAWPPASAVPRHSWLECWDVCLFVCALLLYPTTPGRGLWCGCVCLGSGVGCVHHSWLGCWGVCVFVCPLRLYPATPHTLFLYRDHSKKQFSVCKAYFSPHLCSPYPSSGVRCLG